MEYYTADEVFTTGTMGELTRVAEIDGREILNKSDQNTLDKINELFRAKTKIDGTKLPF